MFREKTIPHEVPQRNPPNVTTPAGRPVGEQHNIETSTKGIGPFSKAASTPTQTCKKELPFFQYQNGRKIEFLGRGLPGVENDPTPCGIILHVFLASQRPYFAKIQIFEDLGVTPLPYPPSPILLLKRKFLFAHPCRMLNRCSLSTGLDAALPKPWFRVQQ